MSEAGSAASVMTCMPTSGDGLGSQGVGDELSGVKLQEMLMLCSTHVVGDRPLAPLKLIKRVTAELGGIKAVTWVRQGSHARLFLSLIFSLSPTSSIILKYFILSKPKVELHHIKCLLS